MTDLFNKRMTQSSTGECSTLPFSSDGKTARPRYVLNLIGLLFCSIGLVCAGLIWIHAFRRSVEYLERSGGERAAESLG